MALRARGPVPGAARHPATLPWEELYDPARSVHLAHSEVTPIIRFLRYAGVTRKVRLPQVLLVLVVSCSPTDLPELRTSVSTLAKDWPQANIVADHVVNPDREQLRRKARQGIHVLHFDGHGGFDPESGVGSIALAGPDGEADWVSGPELASWFLNNPGLRLVLLNACLAGEDGGRTAFAGVASALVRSGVPAVVAMRRPIPDHDAVRVGADSHGRRTLGDGGAQCIRCSGHRVRVTSQLYKADEIWRDAARLVDYSASDRIACYEPRPRAFTATRLAGLRGFLPRPLRGRVGRP